ncbi:unnamed protein product [Periconia digitata]|uniref:Ketoreductase domain-containing protein n=1 Tax=Periconia digitata TaxID=1303443 RepID=A0A9W4URP0_9PLEO|nr:unnamed protein product [Periconia digitata]
MEIFLSDVWDDASCSHVNTTHPSASPFCRLSVVCSLAYTLESGTQLHRTEHLAFGIPVITTLHRPSAHQLTSTSTTTMKIANRTFIISGGASGLGLATARDLHSHGAYVSLLDLNSDAGSSIVAELGPTRARFFQVDVSSTTSIATAIAGTVSWVRETGKEIGGVVAGAGVGMPGMMIDKKNEPLAIESIDFVLGINLRGTLDLIRQALPHMTTNTPEGVDGERGVVVMVASSAAFDGQMGQVAYAASKGAVAALTLPLARDLSRVGIRAVTIAPALFESNMTKMMSGRVRQSLENAMEFPKRAGQPEEFARTVRDSVENTMLNGTVIRLDGAMRMPARL